ncbi:DedA family protein [Staphylospora marina]|uniref:DedA family protein n=1 Tax=Staphylospora marina TaxID=2490858 RepID=UPI000F5BAF05|nr:DedA family protein [Staphylospora marina]
MSAAELVEWVEGYGYAALFFALWLGIVGMPVPDEVIVMTGGLVSSFGLLEPFGAFAVTYMGVVSGLSIGYALGRWWGSDWVNRLGKKEKWNRALLRSERLMNRYGSLALCFSYFLPVVRHILPYLAGIHRMSPVRYAAFSFGAGLVWTGIYFFIGAEFGEWIDPASRISRQGGWLALASLIIIGLAVKAVQRKRDKNTKPDRGL